MRFNVTTLVESRADGVMLTCFKVATGRVSCLTAFHAVPIRTCVVKLTLKHKYFSTFSVTMMIGLKPKHFKGYLQNGISPKTFRI